MEFSALGNATLSGSFQKEDQIYFGLPHGNQLIFSVNISKFLQ